MPKTQVDETQVSELDENPLEDLFNRPSNSPGMDMLGGSGIIDPKNCPKGQEWDEDTQRCIAVVEEEEEVVEEKIVLHLI